jgi:DNA (cytosine-5)-methyltransferase 1
MTKDTSGPTYFASLKKLKLPSSSLKTLRTIQTSDLSRYVKAYENWVTALKQDFSARKKWAELIGANDCSSWPTPTANSMTGSGTSGRKGGLNLQTAVGRWATPTVKGNHNKSSLSKKAGDGLATQSKMWATPTARDWKDGANPSLKVPTNSLLGRQAPRSALSGKERNQSGSLQLNPIFVEWLMGMPMRWSLPDTEPTDYEHLEMQLSRWSQHMRSILYLMIEGNNHG